MASSRETGRGWAANLVQRRLHPDPAPVHLDDLLGDGEGQAGAVLGLGVRAVHLVVLIENPILLIKRYAGASVGHRDGIHWR